MPKNVPYKSKIFVKEHFHGARMGLESSIRAGLICFERIRWVSAFDLDVHAVGRSKDEIAARRSPSTGNLRQASRWLTVLSLFVDDFTRTDRAGAQRIRRASTPTPSRSVNRDAHWKPCANTSTVYDIALSANPKDTRAAFEKVCRAGTGLLDWTHSPRLPRKKLSNYDAMQDGSLTGPSSEPADTTKSPGRHYQRQGSEKEIPLEHRPAE